MASVELQFAYIRERVAIIKPGIACDRAANYVISKFVHHVCEHPVRQYIRPAKSTGKLITAKNVIIVLLTMLALLSSRQVYACCDGNITEVEPAKTDTAGEPVFNLAAIALATATEPEAVAAQKDIKSDAEVTLAAVVESNFVKISDSGNAVADNDTTWDCVADKSNNLTWEVKKNDGGIRDKDHSYSWLHNIKGKNKGISNGGRCKGGVNCDTTSYVHAMNEQKLCGYSDWRLPTRDELETLVEYNSNPQQATINKTYFPEAVPSWYWTASENSQREGYAWYVLFRNGIALNDLKERPKHIRLVRGNRAQ